MCIRDSLNTAWNEVVERVNQKFGHTLKLTENKDTINNYLRDLINEDLMKIGDAGQVDGDHAHGAGGLAGAEEAAGLLPQLTQVKAQAAAHGAHVVGLHIGVDVVGEIGGAVLGGHLEHILSLGKLSLRIGKLLLGSSQATLKVDDLSEHRCV